MNIRDYINEKAKPTVPVAEAQVDDETRVLAEEAYLFATYNNILLEVFLNDL